MQQLVSHSGSDSAYSAILGCADARTSSFSTGSMSGVTPVFTGGAKADGFKMACRWWQRLDCSRWGFRVPPTPAVQLLYLYLRLPLNYFFPLAPSCCFITLCSVQICMQLFWWVSCFLGGFSMCFLLKYVKPQAYIRMNQQCFVYITVPCRRIHPLLTFSFSMERLT